MNVAALTLVTLVSIAVVSVSSSDGTQQKHVTTVGRPADASDAAGGAAGSTSTSLPAGDRICTVRFGVQRQRSIRSVDVGVHYENAVGRFIGLNQDVQCTSSGNFGFTSFFDVFEEKQKFISAFFDDRLLGSTSSSTTSTSSSTTSSTTSTSTTTTVLGPALIETDAADTAPASPVSKTSAAADAQGNARASRNEVRRRQHGAATGSAEVLELATCNFAAPENDLPAAGDFSVEVFFAKDKDGNDIMPLPAGTVTVDCGDTPPTTLPGTSCGDPNDDGQFTATDALFILRAAVGSLNCLLAICDVSGNGTLQASDALLMLRIAVGLLDESALDCPT
ncbi:MAG TPA: hypothetical protein VEL28_06190 [Candidatus Binatia bacterium]|nr:hypothetical protein [Candidatus Binatia bacterium]